MGNFFKKKEAAPKKKSGGFGFGKSKKKEENSGEYVSLGAAWLFRVKGSDMPMLSVRMNKEDIERLIKIAESNDDNSAGFAMFPNRNQREDKNDPDYNLVPHKDDRYIFEDEAEEEAGDELPEYEG